MNGKARTAIGIGVALLAAAAIAFGVWWQSGHSDDGPAPLEEVSTAGDIKAGHVRIGSVTRTDDVVVVRVTWTNGGREEQNADTAITVKALDQTGMNGYLRVDSAPARSGFDSASTMKPVKPGKTAELTYAFQAPKDETEMVHVTVNSTFAADDRIVSKTVRPTSVA